MATTKRPDYWKALSHAVNSLSKHKHSPSTCQFASDHQLAVSPGGAVRSNLPSPIYAGIEIERRILDGIGDPSESYEVHLSICLHDGNFIIDYLVEKVKLNGCAKLEMESLNDPHYSNGPHHNRRLSGITCQDDFCAGVVRLIMKQIKDYVNNHNYKVIGAGICKRYLDETGCSDLPQRLWAEMDIIPFLIDTNGERWIDERAESAARKCVSRFSPANIPRLSVRRTTVHVDQDVIHIADLDTYRATVDPDTWAACIRFAEKVRNLGLKIRFFNSTPQGGGVALMRHSMVRFFKLLGLPVSWHVPKPNPSVFRITKNNHNILQGVAPPTLRITPEEFQDWDDWAVVNAERYWSTILQESHSDIIIIDDPQLCALVPYIRKRNPNCIIIYRSHIELAHPKPNTPAADAYSHLLGHISSVDLFISHPVAEFLPPKDQFPRNKVMLMPASTDPCDGLNKELVEGDIAYYLDLVKRFCVDQNWKRFDWKNRGYFTQIARFDPAKGHEDCIEAYRQFRARVDSELPLNKIPQLLLCGHGAVDDPDGVIILDMLDRLLSEEKYADIANDVMIIRLPPNDVLLNAVLRGSKVALQLSKREGFEVKVSEALLKSRPVVAYAAGGIPLQIAHDVTGFLVPIGSTETVADYLYKLITDRELYHRICHNAREKGRWKEFTTVVNVTNWLWIWGTLWYKKQKELEMELEAENEDEVIAQNGTDGDSVDETSVDGDEDSVKWVRENWRSKPYGLA
ncbi:hypothetical protein BKA69DRAFT_1063102 [Paraphysoderma sedebokerense]|nr:hypothetical protein BKA69DRAFT_1063102 [Paraphysoderma sedebokerense]